MSFIADDLSAFFGHAILQEDFQDINEHFRPEVSQVSLPFLTPLFFIPVPFDVTSQMA
jgi:hypothetical protein